MTTNGTTPDQLEQELEAQRQALALTMAQLQAKFDVKTRVREQARTWQAQAMSDSGSPRPGFVAGVAGVLLVLGLAIWRRRR